MSISNFSRMLWIALLKPMDFSTIGAVSCVALSWPGFVNGSGMTFLWGTHKKILISAWKGHFTAGWRSSFKCSKKHTIWPNFGVYSHCKTARKAQTTQGRRGLCQDPCKRMKWHFTFLGCLSRHLNLWRRKSNEFEAQVWALCLLPLGKSKLHKYLWV